MGLLDEGDTVDEWRAVAPLASGRATELWLVTRDAEPEPRVLVLARPRTAKDPAARERFEWASNEPTLAKQPPRVLATGEWEELPYRVMEYLHGANVEQLVATLARGGERMVPALTITVVRDAARAVQAAQEAGVAHGEIRPRHILLTVEGEVHVIGHRGPHAESEPDGSRYRAPELADGAEAGPRADVFALGLLAWELLTMRRAVIEGSALADVDRFSDDVPAALAEAVGRAVATDPAARPANAGELAAQLDAALGPEGSHAPVALARLLGRVMTERLDELEAKLTPRPSRVPTVAARAGSDGSDAGAGGRLTRPSAAMDFAAALPTPERARTTAARSGATRAPRLDRTPTSPPPGDRTSGILLLVTIALALAALAYLTVVAVRGGV